MSPFFAAGIGLPMIVALGTPVRSHGRGQSPLLDCDAGFVRIDPDRQASRRIEIAMARRAAIEARARTIGAAAVETRRPADFGTGELRSLADAQAAMAAGARLRIAAHRNSCSWSATAAPDIAEQNKAYRAIFAALPDRPITVRLLDVGATSSPRLQPSAEENLGVKLRGVRVALSRP